MTEQFFEDIHPENLPRLTALRDTERALTEYADGTLKDSTVCVEINDCKHPFISLPRMLYEVMADLPNRPEAITAVDLKLNYDRDAEKFTTLFAGLKMDNNYTLAFHRISSHLPDQRGPLFHGAVLNPMGAITRKTGITQLMPEAEVTNILDAVGIGLPKGPQQASWDEIKAILQFAGLWTATTSNSTPLDLIHTVHITDSVEGTTMNTASLNPDIADDGIRGREIIFAVDEGAEPTKPAHSTWKIRARSDSMHETPSIKTLQRIPLEFRLPTLEDYGVEIFLEDNYVRHELSEQAVNMDLDPVYLKAAQQTIAALSPPKN